ncbi:MAG: iron-containing alcohol dehydrogenase [Thermoplasmata archaeon]|nr:iron-containing alcohol dehydrogenase [Thermoplasmata archaeon]
MMGFFTAPRICIGPGSIEQLSSLGARRALVVVDPAVAELGGDRRVREELVKDGAQVQVWRSVRIGPTLDSLDAGTQMAAEFLPDWIVAVGGGSTIDTAKGIWVRYARPDLGLAGLTPLTDLRLRDRARLVAVPTTSGSGSEATWVAQFWNGENRPVEIASRELIPDWALLDPSLPATMPPTVTVDSGMDALAHALEALASAWTTPFSDGLARDAVGTLTRHLPEALEHSDDVELRGSLHSAATMAGLAVSNAQSGLVHALAHAIGPRTGLAHGRLVAILLPWVLEFNFPAAREAYSSLSGVLGAASTQNAGAFAERFRQLNARVGVPATLAGAGVDVAKLRDEMPHWVPHVRNATSFGANPRIPSPQELETLVARVAG